MRSRQTPTSTSGPTPRPRRRRASSPARAVQLRVGQPLVAATSGRGVRRPRRLGLEQLVQGRAQQLRGTRRAVGLRVPGQELLALLRASAAAGPAQPASGVAADRPPAGLRWPSSRSTVAAVEQVGVVLRRPPSARPAPRSRKRREVELGDVHAPSSRALQAQPGASSLRQASGVLQDEQHLEEGVARQVALGRQLLDQALERQVLVRVGGQGRLAAPAPAAPRKPGVARPARRAGPGC